MENGTLNSEISNLTNSLELARNEISNLRRQITALKHVHRKDYEHVKQTLNSWTCTRCKNNDSGEASSSSANESSTDTDDAAEFPYQVIGRVETGFSSKRALPRQPGLSPARGVLRIDQRVLTNPHHALEGLDQFSHMWVLFYFHANESTHTRAKVAPPRLGGVRTGVFATRSPHRPSPIGLSLVKIDTVEDNCVFFSGVDMVDGTPVLDIKPFIPQYDSPYPAQLSCPPQLWHRLHRDSYNDSDDLDLDLQDRLLIGESNSSADRGDGLPLPEENRRVLDGRDSDEVFIHPQEPQNHPSGDLISDYVDGFPTRSASQREAPEGSEGPPTDQGLSGAQGVRVAHWVTSPPVARLSVQFAQDCLAKLQVVTESEAAASNMQSSITSIFSEDPRSTYIRERYPEEPYTCAVEGLSVTCFFDDTAHVCLVTDVDRIPGLPEGRSRDT